MSRRRRSRFRIGRSSWRMRLAALAVIGLFSYLGLPIVRGPGVELSPVSRKTPQPTQGAVTPPGERVLVDRVVDGDTLVLRGGDRVRLIGVDTPETHHPTKPVQPFGPEAFEFTRSMAEGRLVTLRFDPGETKDQYGRTLAYVYVDGQFLNELLLLNGYARALTNYPFSTEMKQRFRAAEAQAKAHRRGVWSVAAPKLDISSGQAPRRAG